MGCNGPSNRGALGRTGNQPSGRPSPIWNVESITRWANPTASVDPPGYTWSFSWSTAVFDLRPDLESQIGNTKQGFQIWDTAARLYVSLNGQLPTLTFNARNLTVTMTNYISVLNANPQAGAGSVAGSSEAPSLILTDTQDVSATFFPVTSLPGLGNVLGVFSRPGDGSGSGEGYPVRYWRVVFNFSYFVAEQDGLPLPANPDPPNDFVITAGMY